MRAKCVSEKYIGETTAGAKGWSAKWLRDFKFSVREGVEYSVLGIQFREGHTWFWVPTENGPRIAPLGLFVVLDGACRTDWVMTLEGGDWSIAPESLSVAILWKCVNDDAQAFYAYESFLRKVGACEGRKIDCI